MIRRSFRIGLWLGLLGGLGYALLRLMQASKPPVASTATAPSSSPPTPWPRLDDVAERPQPPVRVEAAPAPRVEAPAAPRVAAPPKKAAAKKAAPKKVLAPWVDPNGDICPKTHPVKAKLSSKIFQVAGNFAYDRTKPDRCYKDAATAEKDGFRAAKR